MVTSLIIVNFILFSNTSYAIYQTFFWSCESQIIGYCILKITLLYVQMSILTQYIIFFYYLFTNF